MSDDYVYIIPEEPDLVPDEAKRQNAVAYFIGIAPKASDVTASVSDPVEFIHCGQNFGKISCPSCGAVIGLGQWQDWMDQDFRGEEQGFVLAQHGAGFLNAMSVRRVVPNIQSERMDESRKFYTEFLGLEVAMDMARRAASKSNPVTMFSVLTDTRKSHLQGSLQARDVNFRP